jgi:hypothetical protein
VIAPCVRSAILALGAALLLAAPASAAVPTRDEAVLNRRSETSSVKLKLLDVSKSTKSHTKGIHCATTTGQKGASRDTSRSVAPNGGDNRLKQFDPAIERSSQNAGNAGRAAQQRALIDGTSTVVGGIDTQQSVLPDTRQVYEQLSQGVGTAPTVMGAFDQNSAARIQNGITWNQAAQGANLLVHALNVANLFRVGEMSASAQGMKTGVPAPLPSVTGGMCLAGYAGQGTADNPCRPAGSLCQTTAPGTQPDPNCVSRRYIDQRGNVAFYLGAVQDKALTALLDNPFIPAAPVNPTARVVGSPQPGVAAALARQR